MRLIGIVGFKGSGKTALANFLIQNYGCERIAFADPLKDMLKALGLTHEQLYGSLKEVRSDLLCGQTPRFAMQTLGTEWGRMTIGDNIWLNTWRHKVEVLQKAKADAVVCDDVRFPNEVALIKKMGGRVLRVVRPGCNSSDHPSENQIEDLDCDYTIQNSGTLFDLRGRLDKAINWMKAEKKAVLPC